MLRKSDRGKFHDLTSVPRQYGEQRVSEGVEGAELLEAYERGEIIVDEEEVIWREDLNKHDDEDEDDDMEEEDDEDDEEEDDEECPTLVPIREGAEAEGGEDEDEEDDEDEEEEDDEEEEEMDEDDEGWVSVSDDEEGDEEATQPAARDVRSRVDARRILTSEDFQLLDRLKTAQAERARDPKRRSGGGSSANSAMAKIESRKREREEDEEEKGGMLFAVDPDVLAAGKTGKSSKIERIAHVLEGRKESKFEHNGHAGGLTNKEKLRKNNYIMVRRGKREVNNKIRKSNSESRYEKMTAKEQFGRDKRKRRRT